MKSQSLQSNQEMSRAQGASHRLCPGALAPSFTSSSSLTCLAVYLTFVSIFFPNSNWPRLRCRDLLSPSHFSEHKQPAFKTLQLICLHLKTELKNKINDCYQGEDEEHLW